jgi:hypothetical protein
VADLDGDSRPDLVTANDDLGPFPGLYNGNVSVLINLHRRLPALSIPAMVILASALALLGTCFRRARRAED